MCSLLPREVIYEGWNLAGDKQILVHSLPDTYLYLEVTIPNTRSHGEEPQQGTLVQEWENAHGKPKQVQTSILVPAH